MALVGFAGSRSLPSFSVSGGLVARVVGSVVASGRGVAVGCCVGADAAVLSARLRRRFPSSSSGSALSVFAVGGACGSGFWSGSAWWAVSLAAVLAVSPGSGCFAPVSVRWWAGGAASVPLRARLAARSSALVSAVAAGGAGSGLVVFLASPSSVGSVRSARLAAAAGLPVVVFPVGFAASALPSLGAGGWVPAAAAGVWARGFRWLPR